VGFLYPLFLIAGLSLAVPLAIHLFNLRRYKVVEFPNTRFLRNITLRSRRQKEVQNRLLLALRLLFLAALVLAFAQPVMRSRDAVAADRLQVLFLDNSQSMSLRTGVRTGLERGREALRAVITSAAPGTRFLILTAGGPASYTPLPADRALAALDAVEISPAARPSGAVLATLQSLMQTEGRTAADLWWASDFDRTGFDPRPAPDLLRGVRFRGLPVQSSAPRNLFVDTVQLLSPALQSGQEVRLAVRTRRAGSEKETAGETSLQLLVNGQVRSAATPRLGDASTATDTLSFTPDGAGWHRIQIVLADGRVPFDDTFRISARTAPALRVLVLSEGATNPYVQAAFRAYAGFSVDARPVSSVPASFADYNLVILSGVTGLEAATGAALGRMVRDGGSLALFPARTENLSAINAALRALVPDLSADGIDTARQQATGLQSGADLVRDLFESIPPNTELPIATWHYRLRGGLSAGGQAILSFRSGAPLLAQYAPGRGRVYVLASGADAASGNFSASYFFVPFLYQMAAQSRGGDVYALTTGRGQPAFLPLSGADERQTVHLYGPGGLDAVPPQRPSGAGLDVMVDGAVQAPGFYRLAAGSAAKDSVVVALNADRAESGMAFWTPEELRSAWPGADATWTLDAAADPKRAGGGAGRWPAWRWLALLALVLAAAETAVLLRRPRAATAAAA